MSEPSSLRCAGRGSRLVLFFVCRHRGERSANEADSHWHTRLWRPDQQWELVCTKSALTINLSVTLSASTVFLLSYICSSCSPPFLFSPLLRVHLSPFSTSSRVAPSLTWSSWLPIMKFINDQYEAYLQEEININRKKRIPDSRVHCCIYFIPPTGHW